MPQIYDTGRLYFPSEASHTQDCYALKNPSTPPNFPSLHLSHSSFSNSSVALPTSQHILQPFRCFTYVTAHSPTLLSLLLRHRLFTYVTWRAAHVAKGYCNLRNGFTHLARQEEAKKRLEKSLSGNITHDITYNTLFFWSCTNADFNCIIRRSQVVTLYLKTQCFELERF